MRICGIIAEYDPFHNGHAWQLEEARRVSGADLVICVISGCFTQRGMPALFDPHTRAAMALQNGADLVLQFPYSFSVCSAERFALGGVHILKQLGAQALSFGAEPESIPYIEQAALLLEQPTEAFLSCLHQRLDSGDSFPKAQGIALAEALQADPAVFALPNASLAISYARANLRLNTGMALYPIPRSGQYHSELIPFDGTLPSATAVRNAILSEQWDAVKASVPAASFSLIESAVQHGNYHHPQALDPLLRWTLRQENDFSTLPDLSEGIENRLTLAADYTDRSDMVLAVKSKRYSYARVNRLLTHALMGTNGKLLSPLPAYAYVLGFRKEASSLLRNAAQNNLSTPSSARAGETYEMDLDIRADDLWNIGANKPFGAIFREKPLIL